MRLLFPIYFAYSTDEEVSDCEYDDVDFSEPERWEEIGSSDEESSGSDTKKKTEVDDATDMVAIGD